MLNNIYPLTVESGIRASITTSPTAPAFQSAANWIDDEIIWSLVLGN